MAINFYERTYRQVLQRRFEYFRLPHISQSLQVLL